MTDPNHCIYPPDSDHVWELCNVGATRGEILAGLAWLQIEAAAAPEATIVLAAKGLVRTSLEP